MSSKAAIAGNIFSSDSSDSDYGSRSRQRRAASSGSEKPKKVSIRLSNYHTTDENAHSLNVKHAGTPLVQPSLPADVPSGYVPFDKTRAGTLQTNTMIQYENATGKLIKPKYFKRVDTIAGSIVVGFYKNNRRNYTEKLEKIKTLYVQQSASGGTTDNLKETIEISQDQWKGIRRDMIISYEKDTGEYIYKAKFNAFVKSADGTSRMSLTSERGFNYMANPAKIKKIFRHITSNDKTLTVILETLRKLELRVRQLEQKHKK